MGYGFVVGLMHPDALWRNCRRAMSRELGAAGMKRYRANVESSVRQFLVNTLDSPDKFYDHIGRYAGGIIMAVVYGHQVSASGEDELYDMHERSLADTQEAMFGTYLVNAFPIRESPPPILHFFCTKSVRTAVRHLPEWAPGGSFQRFARLAKVLGDKVYNYPTDTVKTQPIDFETCYVKSLLDDPDAKLDEDTIKATAASLYLAGTGTIRGILRTFALCMVIAPEAQKKAQAEIDTVLQGRLPTLDDRDTLPYIDSIISETYRYHPTSPLALPHRTVKDDIVNGYLLKKGTMVIYNSWNSGHDESQYSNPNEFNADRYASLELKEHQTHQNFGYGPRVCPGRFVAEASVWLFVATTLALLSFEPHPDDGVKGPEIDFNPGFISGAVPFKCVIRPRGEKARDVIESMRM
jgi:cytochrome P450